MSELLSSFGYRRRIGEGLDIEQPLMALKESSLKYALIYEWLELKESCTSIGREAEPFENQELLR